MTNTKDMLITSLAPLVWGSTYIVTTAFLPAGYPITAAVLRALPAGLLLLLLVRKLPHGIWWLKVALLGALNFSIFWWLLFEAAYRLPGGIAATVGAIQPLLVIFLASKILSRKITRSAVIAAVMGIVGVSALVLQSTIAFDEIGIIAALGGACSMALGTVLTRHWQPPVPPLVFTSWQLVAGGLLLLPFSLLLEPALPALTAENVLGFAYLSVFGAAATYILWFRGVARLEPSAVSTLGFLSPVMAVFLGWLFVGETLTTAQWGGILLILLSVSLSQMKTKQKDGTPPASPLKAQQVN